jgi:hypothetical protein
MPVEQAGTNPPETQSYDAEMMADVRSAYTEETTKPVDVTGGSGRRARGQGRTGSQG